MARVLPTKFDDVKLFEPEVFPDERGSFWETYSIEKYAALGVSETFVQDSISRSHRNVVRGMHYDVRTAKFVQCLAGKIYDVVVDIREGSPTYLRWEGYDLTEGNRRQLFVPKGFAHGFLALSDGVVVAYKQSAYYDPAYDRGVPWDDPAIGIDWPLSGEPILSEKDKAWLRIAERRPAR